MRYPSGSGVKSPQSGVCAKVSRKGLSTHPAEQSAASDALQRPLRSRFRARLGPGR